MQEGKTVTTLEMTTERLTEGGQLEAFTGTSHGWPSVKAAVDHFHKRDGIIKLPNGYEDVDFDKYTGVKLRVTINEVAA